MVKGCALCCAALQAHPSDKTTPVVKSGGISADARGNSMAKRIDPDRAFPDEVKVLREQGVPFPTWYAGPLYTGNGTDSAVKELLAERDRILADRPEGTSG